MRGHGRFLPWGIAALAVAESTLLGGWLATGATVLALLFQSLLIAVLFLVLLWNRYLEVRRRQWAEFTRAARLRERARLAEDLHDIVGHELSLIAIRAGAIQVHSTGEVAAEAATLRADVQRAVLQLREAVELLNDDRPPSGPTVPAGVDIPALVARAQDAGVDVELHGELGPAIPAPVRLTAHRVVQECLTNAAKHAPGSGVEVRIAAGDRWAEVTVLAGTGSGGAGSGGTGLKRLRRRVEAIGGVFEAGPADGRHVVRAELPLVEQPFTVGGDEDPGRRPRPLRDTLRWALLPALVMTALIAGFYAWTTHDTTMEHAEFDRVSPGQTYAQVRSLLPARQAPMRFAVSAQEPPGARCLYYTDGNFPLGLASYRICHDGTTVTQATDLRRMPLW
ncbi:MAG: histidine kinase [Nocardiopsaceae bacterium]|nr:histidine kinase [Nocardiopsaceae bacterium]